MIRDFLFFSLGGATTFLIGWLYLLFKYGFMYRGYNGTNISGGEGDDTIININVPDKKGK